MHGHHQNGAQAQHPDHASAAGGASISDFFVVRDPALLRQYQHKRKRSAGSFNDGMQPPRKRMFAGQQEEEDWVGPYGV
jgi:hypothetical protein